MKSKLKYFITGAVAMIVFVLLFLFNGIIHIGQPEPITYIKTDTVFVKKPYKEVQIKYIEKPVTVYVHKVDTVFREKMEKEDLISSVEITPKLAKIHTLTPKGVPLISSYPLPDFKEIQIDHLGNMQVKKKRGKKLKKAIKIVGAAGIFAGGFILGSRGR